MTTADALLRAILVDPFDDAARMVFADWLEEQGQGLRAEFVRVQIARSKLPEKDVNLTTTRTGDYSQTASFRLACGGKNCLLLLDQPIHRSGCRWAALRDRERYLLNLLANGAWDCWGGQALPFSVESEHRRGFIEYVALASKPFLKHAAALFSQHPITRVKLLDKRPSRFSGWACWVDDPEEVQPSARHPSYWLPRELATYLGEPTEHFHSSTARTDNDRWHYDSEDEAAQALSWACCRFGREAAGLPPLGTLPPGARRMGQGRKAGAG